MHSVSADRVDQDEARAADPMDELSEDTDSTDRMLGADGAEGNDDPPFVKKFEAMDAMEAQAKKQAYAKVKAIAGKETISKRDKQVAKAVEQDLQEQEEQKAAE